MNILDGARLANRTAEAGTASAAVATTAAVGAALSILSIKAAIEGGESFKQQRVLQGVIENIRHVAFSAQKRAKKITLLLDKKEKEAMEALNENGGKAILAGLNYVAKWFIGGVLRGVKGVIVPAFSMLTSAVVRAVGMLVTNPLALVGLGLTTGSYLLYRKFIDVTAGNNPSKSSNAKGGTTSTPKPPPAVEQPKAEPPTLPAGAPKAPEAPTSSSTASPTPASRFIPRASTSTPAPGPTTVIINGKPVQKEARVELQRNNPGNVEFRNQPGATLTKGSRFATFPNQEEGLYNIGRQLQLYDSRGDNTIEKMIKNYAPAKDYNDTPAYIAKVSKDIGYDPKKRLDMSDPLLVKDLIKAVVGKEIGRLNPYTDAQYLEAATRSIAYRNNKYQDEAYELEIPTYGVITSRYGERLDPVDKLAGKKTIKEHRGIDIGASIGTSVYAATDGIAYTKSPSQGFGNLVTVVGSKYLTRYGHLSSFLVKNGQRVVRGQLIAQSGNSGRTTGPHLHFEVFTVDAKGKEVGEKDPLSLLPPMNSLDKKGTLGFLAEKVRPLPTIEESTIIQREGRLIQLRN